MTPVSIYSTRVIALEPTTFGTEPSGGGPPCYAIERASGIGWNQLTTISNK